MDGGEETEKPGDDLVIDSPLELPGPGALPSRIKGVVSRRIAGETILVPTKSTAQELDNIFTLNEVASTVWELIDGARSISDISDAIASEFDVPPGQALGDTRELLAMFHEAEVVDINPPRP